MPLGLMPDDGHGSHASRVDALACRRCLGSPLEMMWSLVKPTYLMMVPMVAWIEPFLLIEHGACDEAFEEDDGALVPLLYVLVGAHGLVVCGLDDEVLTFP